MKILFTRCVVALVLLSSSACARQAEVARRDFILGADHGWIDLALMPAAGNAGDKACSIDLAMNKESLFATEAPQPQGESAPSVGFRLPVPVGKLSMALTVDGCVPAETTLTVPVEMAKDKLVRLQFDGLSLKVADTRQFEPVTLDGLSSEMAQLKSENSQSYQATEKLTGFVKWSLGLNALLLAAVVAGFLRRRR